MLKRTLLVIIIALLILLTASCWDQIEIERLAFIIGIAVDKADEADKIEVTYQIAHPEAFMEESKSSESYWNVSKIGNDLSEITNSLSSSLYLKPTFEHCQIILVGEDLARESMDKYLDFIIRTYDIRRRLKIGVVQGQAKDVLNMDLKSSMVPSLLVPEIMHNNTKESFEMTDYMYLGNLHTAYVEKYDFIMPRILVDKEKIVMRGGAVFNNFKLVGWLSGHEMIGARFLRGDVGSGPLVVELPAHLGERIVLNVYETSSKLRPEIQNDKLYISLDIKVEGDVNEIISPQEGVSKQELMTTATEMFEQYLEERIVNTFNFTKSELKSDPFRIKEKLQSYYPNYWSKNKDNWEEIYGSADLITDIKVRIRRMGESKE